MKHLFGRSISSVENGQLFRTNNEEKKEVIWSEKYRHDLFYILPFYHRELPLHVKKLIVLDADLEFRTDTQWPKSVDKSHFVGTACNSYFSDQDM